MKGIILAGGSGTLLHKLPEIPLDRRFDARTRKWKVCCPAASEMASPTRNRVAAS